MAAEDNGSALPTPFPTLRAATGWGAIGQVRRPILGYPPPRTVSQSHEHKPGRRQMIAFMVNGQRKEVGVDGDTPLLWVLREHLKMTGTKFGCGVAACGACTVHVEGNPIRSCITPVSLVEGAAITTIEGLSPDGSHPLQKAWIAEQVPQCGYCQSGQIMQAAALL